MTLNEQQLLATMLDSSPVDDDELDSHELECVDIFAMDTDLYRLSLSERLMDTLTKIRMD